MRVNFFPIAAVLFSFGFLIFGAIVDRPTVEVSVHTHKCVRAYDPHGLLPCVDAMKRKHRKVFVGDQKDE